VLMKKLQHQDSWERGPQAGLLQNSMNFHGRRGIREAAADLLDSRSPR
jgi:hypothetical protein